MLLFTAELICLRDSCPDHELLNNRKRVMLIWTEQNLQLLAVMLQLPRYSTAKPNFSEGLKVEVLSANRQKDCAEKSPPKKVDLLRDDSRRTAESPREALECVVSSRLTAGGEASSLFVSDPEVGFQLRSHGEPGRFPPLWIGLLC